MTIPKRMKLIIANFALITINIIDLQNGKNQKLKNELYELRNRR